MANNKPFVIKNGLSASRYLTPTEASYSGSSFSVDLSTTSYRKVTLNSNTTVTFTNPPAVGTAVSFTVDIDNSSNYSVTWPSSVKWHKGFTPTISANSRSTFIFLTTNGGAAYFGRKTEGDIS